MGPRSTTSKLESSPAVGLRVPVWPPAPHPPCAGVGDRAGNSSQDRSGGKGREGKSEQLLPRMVKKITKKAPKA